MNLLITPVLLGFAQVHASEPSEEESLLFSEIPVVTGASKHEQRVSEAPASVTIVTAEQIQRFGWRTVGEILDGVRSIHVTRDRNYAFAGVRGFSPPSAYGERTLIMLDGFRINNPLYDGGNVDRNIPIDVDDIDRIEVILGPGSALYGTNAVLGVVNIITRRGRDLAGGNIAVVGGSYNTLGGHTSWGNRFDNDLEVLIAAGGRWSEGQDHYYPLYDDPLTNNGIAEDLDAEWDFDTLTKIGFRDLQFEAFLGAREKEFPTGAFETHFNGQRSFTNETNAGVSLSFDRTTSSGSQLHSALQMQYYDYFGDYMYNWGDADAVDLIANHDKSNSLGWGAETHIIQPVLDSHQVTIGAEVRHVFRMTQYNEDRLPDPVVNIDLSDSIFHGGVYLQDEWKVVDRVRVTSGVRADMYPDFGLSINPRLALLVDPTSTTTIKLLYGTAFRAPNGYERFYDDGGWFNKAPDSLDPEKIRTAEGVVEQGLGSHWSAVATVYHSSMTDLISTRLDDEGLAVFDNIDSTRNKGAELGAEGHPSWLEARGSVSLHDVRDTATNDVLHNAPLWLGKALVSPAVVPNHVFLGMEMLAVGSRTDPGGVTLGPHAIVNANLLTRDLIEDLNLAVSVRNVLGTKYRHTAGYEIAQAGILQDGRNYRLTASYEF